MKKFLSSHVAELFLWLFICCSILCFCLFSSCNVTYEGYPRGPVSNRVWKPSNIKTFEKTLEYLRKHYHIPSLSVGIVHNRQLIWKKGFGYADIENKIVPDENTVYHIASVSKTFGSILLMQQVEAGKANLDDPIARYGINLGARWGNDERIKVKHLLTHTASGNSLNGFKPGYSFRYNGSWYSQLKKVIEKASGKSYGELLMQNIIQPLQLKNTVPSLDDSLSFALTGYNRDEFKKKVAKPYNWQGHHLAPVTNYRYSFGPAAGLMSCVADLAVYAVAIDEELFLQPHTWEQIFTGFKTPRNKVLQYGLGWYVKNYDGIKVVWHTGWWWGYSALFIKIPEKDLTFIVLANSQDLTRPFYQTLYPVPLPNPLTVSINKDLLVSDFARVFFEHFVY